ncbi:hypothetical protein F5144DRAFT_10463 [Chaetomium tenue]|uniref:Uncharacterized protein n=1 Tax=Chaetomium tenue TaxID=1854479 RepID=A0ACB7PL69_9PEZI|nr:hypothetical protein F5144DRAFT_10463 [Chaetomium globosum]
MKSLLAVLTALNATERSPDQQTQLSHPQNPCRYPSRPGAGKTRGLCDQKRQPVLPPNPAGIGMPSIHRFSAFFFPGCVFPTAKTRRVEGLAGLAGFRHTDKIERSEPFLSPQATGCCCGPRPGIQPCHAMPASPTFLNMSKDKKRLAKNRYLLKVTLVPSRQDKSSEADNNSATRVSLVSAAQFKILSRSSQLASCTRQSMYAYGRASPSDTK